MRQPLARALTDLFSRERPAPLAERGSGPASLGEFSLRLNNTHKSGSQTGLMSRVQQGSSDLEGLWRHGPGAAAWIVTVSVNAAAAWIVDISAGF